MAKKMAEDIRQAEIRGEELLAQARLSQKQRLEQAVAEADTIRRDAKTAAEQATAEILAAAERDAAGAAADAKTRADAQCRALREQAAAHRSQAVEAVTALLIK